MKFSLVLVGVIIILLIVCGWLVVQHKTAYAPVDTTNETSQSTTSVSYSLLSDVYPLYDQLTWKTPFATSSYALSGNEIVSEPVTNVTNLAGVFTPFDQYYSNKLTALGWVEDITRAAGGPGSSITTYKKGSASIVLSYHSVFHTNPPDQPEQCPCDITFSIFSSSNSTQD